jgi:UDP-N-acetylglucosamine acyltransferase
MNNVSKLAVVSPNAKIGENVTIKDFAIIEDDVIIEDNVTIHYNAQIENGARLAKDCKIFKGAVISCLPQDLKYKGEYTTTEIGEGTTIREYTTISRGTEESKITTIGKQCLFMNYVHVAHDCQIGDNVVISNASGLAGHVIIGSHAILGGGVAAHQFVHIGEYSFVALYSRVTQDVPPYILAGGYPLHYKGLNLVGLNRKNFSEEAIRHIKQTYNYIYNSKYNISDALKAIKESIPITDEVKNIINFIEKSERGIIRRVNGI